MSQLDISISFVQLFELIICFYFFVHCIKVFIKNFWYSYKLRTFTFQVYNIQNRKGLNVLFLRQLLKS